MFQWVSASLAIALFLETIVFYFGHHQIDDEIYILEQEDMSEVPMAEK